MYSIFFFLGISSNYTIYYLNRNLSVKRDQNVDGGYKQSRKPDL